MSSATTDLQIEKSMKHTYIYCGIAAFLFVFPLSTQSQVSGWEAGAQAGPAWYFGDMNNDFHLGHPGLSGGVSARYNFNERINLKLAANYARVRGDDQWSGNTFQQARNLHFRSDNFEGIAQLEFNFLPYKHGSKDFFTPYLFAGLGLTHFNPKAEYQGVWVALQPLGTEGQFEGEEYSRVQGALVYGMGFKFDINYYWSINIEAGGRRLYTDYLDDVSTSYPDLDDLERRRGEAAAYLSDPSINGEFDFSISEPGRQRGNKRTDDSYALFQVGIMYWFGTLPCPAISEPAFKN